MSDIRYCDEQLARALEALEEELRIVQRARGGSRKEGQARLNTALQRVRTLRSGFTLELRQLQDKSEVKEYQQKLKGYEQRIASSTKEIKWLQTEGDRNALFAGKNADKLSIREGADSNSAVLKEALNTQDKTKQSLENTQRLISQSKEVGTATAEELDRQRERIKNITDEVINIESSLNTADKTRGEAYELGRQKDMLIRTFTRRMMTDRLILCMSLLVFLGIVFIVVYSVIDPDAPFNVPDEVKPPNPVEVFGRRLRQESKLGHF